jgi:hypothetical protein
VPAPPQPRRLGKLSKRADSRRDVEEERPSLPPRRPTVDLLAGDGEEDVGGWKSLRPT